MDPAIVKDWWSIAQAVGAGGCFVLGIACYMVWTTYKEELSYSRARDKDTTEVLNKLTGVLSKAVDDDKNNLSSLKDCIQQAEKNIITHIDLIRARGG